MSEEKNETASLAMIGSMLIFGSIGIFRRYIPLSSALLSFIRGFLGTLFLLIFLLFTKRKPDKNISGKQISLLFLTGAYMGLNWIFLFEAYQYTDVGKATLCYYMQPTIVILSSPLFFKEKISFQKGICVLLSLIGMVLVSGAGNMADSELKGLAFGLAAAFLYACVAILNKKIQIPDIYEKTLLQLFSSALVLLPYVLMREDLAAIPDLDIISLIMTLIVGLVHTGLAYVLYFYGLSFLKAQSAALLSYIDPVSALVFAAFFFKEKMTICGFIGAFLIIGSAIWNERRKDVE